MKSLNRNVVFPFGVRGIFFIVLILSIFFGYELGIRPFAHPDEGRYVEIAREMTVSGDYITPKLNDVKYFEKPALFYWMQAFIINIFGINEAALRIWNVIFAILGCLFLFFASSGSRIFNNCVKNDSDDEEDVFCSINEKENHLSNIQFTSFLSVAILATNILYYAHSRIIIIDLVFSMLMCSALWCFYFCFVLEDYNFLSKKKWITFFYIFCALAGLAKGLVAFVLPGMIILCWIAFTKKWRIIIDILYMPAIVLFLLLFVPWHALVALKNKDFMYFYFVGEHFLRYLTTMHCRYQPCWFFIPIVLVGLFPWIGFAVASLVASCKSLNKKNYEMVFLLLWIGIVFAFYSISKSKLIPYILPVLPPIALITAKFIGQNLFVREKLKYVFLLNAITLSFIFLVFLFFKNELNSVCALDEMKCLLYVIEVLITIDIFIMMMILKKNFSIKFIILMHVFLAINIMWTINKASYYYQIIKKPSSKRMAEIVRMNCVKGDLVYCYKAYYQDFPVYLNKTIGVVDYKGELEFGINDAKDKMRFPGESEFFNIWSNSCFRVFLLMSRQNYGQVFASKKLKHRMLDFDANYVVLTNK